jgi:hypothetical protein
MRHEKAAPSLFLWRINLKNYQKSMEHQKNPLFLTSASIAVFALLITGCASATPIEPAQSSEPVATEEQQQPQASPKFSDPWPTQVNNYELKSTALFQTYKFFDEIRKPDCGIGYKLHLGEHFLDVHKPLVDDLTRSITEIFCDYLKQPLIIIGGSNDFVMQTVAENSYPSDEFGGICGYKVEDDSGAACAFYGVAWIGKSWGTLPKPEGQRATLAAHEIFHLVHDGLDPDSASQSNPPGHPFFRPVWFIEGAGEYFGSSVASYLELNPYGTGAPTDINGEFLDVAYLSDLEGLEIRGERAFGNENYFSGKRAIEYMIASKGVEAVLDIWVKMGGGMNFYDAFENAMGLSLSDFYAKFAEMHSQLYGSDYVTGNF